MTFPQNEKDAVWVQASRVPPLQKLPEVDAYFRIYFEGAWSAELEFRQCGPKEVTALPVIASAYFDTCPFEIDIGNNQFCRAFEWINDLDALVVSTLEAGGRVTYKFVHASRQESLRELGGLTWDQYWQMHFSVADLIRPLFLKQPSLDLLKPYQLKGVEWLRTRTAAILADDMGLGKTIQCIAALAKCLNDGAVKNAIVVAPKALVPNWLNEFRKWAPQICCLPIAPSRKEREGVWITMLRRCHVAITNYEQFRGLRVEAFPVVDVLIADEAHKIRNLSAAVTKALKRIPRKNTWALTGTPIERDRKDLANLLSTIEPDRFQPSYAALDGSQLRSYARPYILRRLKADVLPELPPVVEYKELLELTSLQKSAYRRALHLPIREGGAENALARITLLRQICDCAPVTGASSKLDRIHAILGEIAATREKAIVFSYQIRPLKLLEQRLQKAFGKEKIYLLEGSQDVATRQSTLNAFRNREDSLVLLASSRVASEGLNLTEANHVLFVNQWWNPSANDQARDRVVRIGQSRSVRVVRFVCLSTIEEILEMILKKKKLEVSEIVEALNELRHPPTLAEAFAQAAITGR